MSHKTTATLRATLLDAIEQVRAGTMEPRRAKAIADLADQVIGTADLELRYSQIVSRLDKENQGISPGPLLLTGKGDGSR